MVFIVEDSVGFNSDHCCETQGAATAAVSISSCFPNTTVAATVRGPMPLAVVGVPARRQLGPLEQDAPQGPAAGTADIRPEREPLIFAPPTR